MRDQSGMSIQFNPVILNRSNYNKLQIHNVCSKLTIMSYYVVFIV